MPVGPQHCPRARFRPASPCKLAALVAFALWVVPLAASAFEPLPRLVAWAEAAALYTREAGGLHLGGGASAQVRLAGPLRLAVSTELSVGPLDGHASGLAGVALWQADTSGELLTLLRTEGGRSSDSIYARRERSVEHHELVIEAGGHGLAKELAQSPVWSVGLRYFELAAVPTGGSGARRLNRVSLHLLLDRRLRDWGGVAAFNWSLFNQAAISPEAQIGVTPGGAWFAAMALDWLLPL